MSRSGNFVPADFLITNDEGGFGMILSPVNGDTFRGLCDHAFWHHAAPGEAPFFLRPLLNGKLIEPTPDAPFSPLMATGTPSAVLCKI